MLSPGPAPLARHDRVRHLKSGYFGTVQRCEKVGITWVCAVVFDADLQKILPGNGPETVEVMVAADDLEVVKRSGVRLVADNSIPTPRGFMPHPETARSPARPSPSSPLGDGPVPA